MGPIGERDLPNNLDFHVNDQVSIVRPRLLEYQSPEFIFKYDMENPNTFNNGS